jgi:hypothetical protein
VASIFVPLFLVTVAVVVALEQVRLKAPVNVGVSVLVPVIRAPGGTVTPFSVSTGLAVAAGAITKAVKAATAMQAMMNFLYM